MSSGSTGRNADLNGRESAAGAARVPISLEKRTCGLGLLQHRSRARIAAALFTSASRPRGRIPGRNQNTVGESSPLGGVLRLPRPIGQALVQVAVMRVLVSSSRFEGGTSSPLCFRRFAAAPPVASGFRLIRNPAPVETKNASGEPRRVARTIPPWRGGYLSSSALRSRRLKRKSPEPVLGAGLKQITPSGRAPEGVTLGPYPRMIHDGANERNP